MSTTSIDDAQNLSAPILASSQSSSIIDESDINDGKSFVQLAITNCLPERRKKKPYKELTLVEKVQLIHMAEENAGMSQASIAEKYAIAKSNVCRILQRKQEYLRAYQSAGFAGSRKRKLRGETETFNATTTTDDAAKGILAHKQTTKTIHPNYSAGLNMPYKDFDMGLNHLKADLNKSSGNETLRAHMYKQHQISRMFMCRCCNWAFPDKTSLHMHMQAKEDGKTISVPVIGKGNLPTQNCDVGVQMNIVSSQAPTLHTPQPRTPFVLGSNNPFQMHNLNAVSSLVNASNDPAVLHAATSLFPQMLLLQDQSNSGLLHNNLNEIQERIMMNNLLAHSGFGLSTWLANLHKMNCGLGQDATNQGGTSTKSEPEMTIVETDEEINVDLNGERENEMQRENFDLNNDINRTEESEAKNGNDKIAHVKFAYYEEDKNSISWRSNTTSNGTRLISSDENSTSPEMRSPGEGEVTRQSFDTSKQRDSYADSTMAENSQCDETLDLNGDIIVSPSETHSSLSPSTECCDCSIYKKKLAAAINRCRYLEGKTVNLQTNALRYSTQATIYETSARQIEQESHALRDRNEILQRKLMECQEKTLSFMQTDQNVDMQAIALYLNDILKTTLLR